MEASLDRAAKLLNRRPIDMSLPWPTSSSSASASSSASSSAIRQTPTVAVKEKAAATATAEAVAAWPTTSPPSGKRRMPIAPDPPGEKSSSVPSTPGDGAAADGIGAEEVTLLDRAVDRDRRLARSAAFNNRAVLLIAAGRVEEACPLLRACVLLLPEQPRPLFNLTLALWRLGHRRAACAHWLEARNWLGGGGGGRGAGGVSGGASGRDSVEAFTRLLASARRRKVSLLKSCARLVCERDRYNPAVDTTTLRGNGCCRCPRNLFTLKDVTRNTARAAA